MPNGLYLGKMAQIDARRCSRECLTARITEGLHASPWREWASCWKRTPPRDFTGLLSGPIPGLPSAKGAHPNNWNCVSAISPTANRLLMSSPKPIRSDRSARFRKHLFSEHYELEPNRVTESGTCTPFESILEQDLVL